MVLTGLEGNYEYIILDNYNGPKYICGELVIALEGAIRCKYPDRQTSTFDLIEILGEW